METGSDEFGWILKYASDATSLLPAPTCQSSPCFIPEYLNSRHLTWAGTCSMYFPDDVKRPCLGKAKTKKLITF